ncbi:hypothetical protein VTO73DRAFT_2566 [Trametes versicolor]
MASPPSRCPQAPVWLVRALFEAAAPLPWATRASIQCTVLSTILKHFTGKKFGGSLDAPVPDRWTSPCNICKPS